MRHGGVIIPIDCVLVMVFRGGISITDGQILVLGIILQAKGCDICLMCIVNWIKILIL